VDQGDRIPLDFAMRRRRVFEERVLLRFPGLAHRLFELVRRLPRGSRPRRWALARITQLAASAANRRDFDVLLVGFDHAIDYRGVPSGPTGWVVPLDLLGHHHGHAGYRHVWQTMLESFPDLTLYPEELIDAGDRLFSATRLRGHGSSSGLEIDQFLYQVFTFRRGLVVKQEDFAEREPALEAAGLSTSPE
jgi:ketosteroid isomerase-like protein